jgi:ribosomal protein S19E (S16A)
VNHAITNQALRRLTKDTGVNSAAAQGRLLRRLGQQDLTQVAAKLSEGTR